MSESDWSDCQLANLKDHNLVGAHALTAEMMARESYNYTALAQFLCEHPDLLSLRRFRELQIRNLLFYQAELTHLQLELQEIEDRDAKDYPNPSDRVNHRWSSLMATESAAQTGSSTMTSEYCKNMLVIRKTLASYSEFLALQEISCI